MNIFTEQGEKIFNWKLREGTELELRDFLLKNLVDVKSWAISYGAP